MQPIGGSMDQIKVGNFIAAMRKEKGLTQESLGERLGVTNKTIINRCAKLTNNGFLVPNIVSQRIRSYSLSEFAKRNDKKILSKIG